MKPLISQLPSQTSRTGASVVEFAIVAPLLFMLLLGIIEFGRLLMVQQIITTASREGARQAVLDGASLSKVKATTVNHLKAAGVPGSTIAVHPDPATVSFSSPVSVTVSVPFEEVSWLGKPFFLDGIILKSNTVMRSDYSR